MKDDMIELGEEASKSVVGLVSNQVANGASNLGEPQFVVEPSHSAYDDLKDKLAPYIDFNSNGLKIAQFNVNGTPMTITVNPTLSSIMITLNGTF
jgi:hypothetical protein